MNRASLAFAGLALSWMGLGACQREPTAAESAQQSGRVVLAPRFVAATTVPLVTRLECKLSLAGQADQIVNVAHSPGDELILGTVKSGADFSIAVSGYDSIEGQRIVRFWGSSNGEAGDAASQIVSIHTDVSAPKPNPTPDSLKVNGTLALNPGTWYTLDGSDPRVSNAATEATGLVKITAAGTVKAATRTPSNAATGAPAIWSDVSTWTFSVSDVPTASIDTALSTISVNGVGISITGTTILLDSFPQSTTSATFSATPRDPSAVVTYSPTNGMVGFASDTARGTITVTNGGKSLRYTLRFQNKRKPTVAWRTSWNFTTAYTDTLDLKSIYGIRTATDPYGTSVKATTTTASVARAEVTWADAPKWGAYASVCLSPLAEDKPADLTSATAVKFSYRTSDESTPLEFQPWSPTYPGSTKTVDGVEILSNGVLLLASFPASTTFRAVTVNLPGDLYYLDWMERDYPDQVNVTWNDVRSTINRLCFAPRPLYNGTGSAVVNRTAWLEIKDITIVR